MRYIIITRDGERVAGPMPENMELPWFHRFTNHSADWAIAHEGYAVEEAEWERLRVEDALVGRTADGTRVYVSMGIERHAAQDSKRTVTHERMPEEYLEFTAQGHTVEQYRREWSSAGQMLDDLLEVVEPAPGLSLDDLKRIHQIWRAWHLNGMKAACAHMPADARERWDRREAVVCEESGYSYGSAWLVQPLPVAILEEVRTLVKKLEG